MCWLIGWRYAGSLVVDILAHWREICRLIGGNVNGGRYFVSLDRDVLAY